ncbi:hypothetical protein L596_019180 [Steinernema carpocapsae]|uniref:Uncharacterized protein n=1 Tax=Steinernema carpocapsae TaxID=34508 RepID=A0A4U5N7V4_STECR|nr:hypothetical protein L596_019180 [Steinernema carpocapsae]
MLLFRECVRAQSSFSTASTIAFILSRLKSFSDLRALFISGDETQSSVSSEPRSRSEEPSSVEYYQN